MNSHLPIREEKKLPTAQTFFFGRGYVVKAVLKHTKGVLYNEIAKCWNLAFNI